MPMSCERNHCPTGDGRDVPVPPADMKAGFFSPYIIVPKKSSGLRPILGLRILNWAFHKPPFKMLMQNRVFGCIRPQVRSAAFDLKDSYFHVSILPCHRPFLRFASLCLIRTSISVQVLPFGLSLSPHVFTKVAEAALVPLREQGVRILNYLDDWLILAQSQAQLCEHRDLVLSHLSQLGLRVNWEKSKLLPMQRIAFLGMEFGFSQSNSAPHAGTHSVGVELLEYVQEQDGGTTKTVSEAAGGIWRLRLHMGVPLEQVSRHAVVYTDASTKGWGATFNGLAVSGVWTGPQLHWHINCLELLAVHLALNRLKILLQGEHVLVRTDSTVTVAYINRQGGLRSRRMSQFARHLLLWSRKYLRSLCAIHILGLLNRTTDELRSPESGDSIPRRSS